MIWHVNGAPVRQSERPRVQAQAGAKSDHFAVPDLDPCPDRRRPFANWKRNQDHARGYRHKGDPRQFLLHGCQPPAVERELGQSRAELAAAGDQQAGDTVCAQSRLKILRFTKDGCAAARHFFSPPWPEAASLGRGAFITSF